MANQRKRKAVAPEPSLSATAEAAPPAKRGRPPKAAKDQENAQDPAADAPPPKKRGRPPKEAQEQEQEQEIVPEPVEANASRKRGRPKKNTSEVAVQGPTEPLLAPTSAKEPKSKGKVEATPTRSSRRLSDAAAKASASPSGARETRQTANGKPTSSVVAVKEAKGKGKAKATAKAQASAAPVSDTLAATKVTKSAKGRKAAKGKANGAQLNGEADIELSNAVSRSVSVPVAVPANGTGDSEDEKADDEAEDDGPSYWLMKAEPESRIEKGKDVKFSIDDLKATAEPEGWDGVRNPTARNNMRMMMKGDLAFFYHSNCKVPGIAGIMEIVHEHSPDETALDPSHPYYDPKSTAESPKWCKVHVTFRRKFPTLLKLKELQKYAKEGGALQHMQTLRQSRLSVSKVTKKEWEFIITLVEDDDDDAEAEAETVDKVGPSSSSAPVAQMVGGNTKPVSNGKGSVNGGQSSATKLLTGEVSRVAETSSNGLNSIREVVEPGT
ncbi:MAG: hypothetical protein Q9191_008125 [Dirinaria sp. TL-2023a]